MRLKVSIAVLVIAWLFAGATMATAQTPGMLQHPLIPSNLIDGSQTPEQIPDGVAFQLWLHHHFSEPTLVMPRLPVADLAVLNAALASYGQQFPAVKGALDAAIAYDAASGTNTANPNSFWVSHYNLTNSLWNQIQADMTPAGFARFSAYLQKERAGMQVSPYNYGMPNSATLLKETSMVASAMPGMAMPPGTNMTPNYSSYFTMNTFPSTVSNVDNFANDANGGLNSRWTTVNGTFAISGGALTVTAVGSPGVAWAYDKISTYSPDQCSAASLNTFPSTGGSVGVNVRVAASAETFYQAYWWSGSSWDGVYLYKVVNGTPTQLGNYKYTPAAGDSLKICATGTTIRALVNDQQVIKATDGSITSGQPGMLGIVGGGTLAGWTASGYAGIQISGEISGNTICNGGGTCPTATHTPQVTNQITPHGKAAIGGTNYGTPVPPASYASATNNQTYTLEQLGPGYGTGILDDEIVCSIVGDFFSAGGPSGISFPNFEIATTMSQNLTAVAGPYFPIYGTLWYGYELTPRCVYTPDWNPNWIADLDLPTPPEWLWAPYYHTESVCVRAQGAVAGSKWSCLGDDSTGEPVDPYPWAGVWYGEWIRDITLYGNLVNCFCSNWDNGYNVWDSPPNLPPVNPLP